MFKGYHRIVCSTANTHSTYLLFLYVLISVLFFSYGERKNKPDTGADEYVETHKYNHIPDISEVGYKTVINRSVQ